MHYRAIEVASCMQSPNLKADGWFAKVSCYTVKFRLMSNIVVSFYSSRAYSQAFYPQAGRMKCMYFNVIPMHVIPSSAR